MRGGSESPDRWLRRPGIISRPFRYGIAGSRSSEVVAVAGAVRRVLWLVP